MFTLAIKLTDKVLASCSSLTLYAACVGLCTSSLKSTASQPWNLLPFTETESLLWCSRQPALGLYPAQNKWSPYLYTIRISILKCCLIYACLPDGLIPSGFPTQIHHVFVSPSCAISPAHLTASDLFNEKYECWASLFSHNIYFAAQFYF
jgi:hypothetical protein